MAEGKKKADWNAIRAEYIAGGISQRELAEKYDISPGVLMQKANKERWKKQKDDAEKKAIEKTKQKVAQKTADAAVANAVKLEKARALLIDKIVTALENMPKNGGTRVRQSQTDRDTGKQMSVDYDLTALVTAFEKLSGGTTADFERQKQFAKENNTTLAGYAEMFKRPARTRTLDEIESGGDLDVQD